jgi:NADH-quinone oxidoreductase subunit N
MLTAVISAFLYLRIVVSMFMSDDEATEPRVIPIPLAAGIALVLSVGVTIGVGLFPGVLATPAKDATPVLVAEPDPEPAAPATP